MSAHAYNDKLASEIRTHIGLVRSENQDCAVQAQVPLGYFCVVADGMGGHKGGRVAAELVVEGMERCMKEAPASSSVVEVIRTAFSEVNEVVFQRANSGDPAVEKMGSTAVMLLLSGSSARVAHVGDSRAYLYRNGKLGQLTKDHTMVQKMVDAGMLTPEDARGHPNASVLERAVGHRSQIKVDISDEIPILEGDAFLLCSDGLSGYVADGEIEAVLQSKAKAREIPDHLLQLALHKGGEDNITVAFVQYGARRPGPPAAAGGTRKLETPHASPAAHGLFGIRIQTVLLLGLLLLIVLGVIYSNKTERKEDQTKLSAPRDTGGAAKSGGKAEAISTAK